MKTYEAKLTNPQMVAQYMEGATDEDPTVEWLYVIPVNARSRPLGRVMVTKGTANASLAHPREVFKPAIIAGATAVIVVHNHPSGDPAPSSADLTITRRLKEAGSILDIQLLDHIILGTKADDPTGFGLYSFCEAGLV